MKICAQKITSYKKWENIFQVDFIFSESYASKLFQEEIDVDLLSKYCFLIFIHH